MSSTAFPGWYVTFQTAVLLQLPRPEDGITKEEAEALFGNQAELKLRLANIGTGKPLEQGKSTPPAKFKTPDGTIIRNIKVNRTLTGKQAVNATGRKKYVSDAVVDAMPSGTELEMEVHLVPLKRYVGAAKLDEELAALGYKMIDPIANCALNEAEPELADKYPNGVQWKDAGGKFCYALFRRDLDDGRCVYVSQYDFDWRAYWFFPCARK